jgi:hypothetical protein
VAEVPSRLNTLSTGRVSTSSVLIGGVSKPSAAFLFFFIALVATVFTSSIAQNRKYCMLPKSNSQYRNHPIHNFSMPCFSFEIASTLPHFKMPSRKRQIFTCVLELSARIPSCV